MRFVFDRRLTFPPATGKVVTSVAAGTKADIDIAAKAAQRAYKTSWGLKVSGTERGKLLFKLADIMEKHMDEFAALDVISNGVFVIRVLQ